MDRRNRLAQAGLDVGVDARDPLHVLPVDLHRSCFAADREQVAASTTWPAGVLRSVADVGNLLAVRFAEPDDDRVLVAAFAELRSRGSGDVRLDRGGHRLRSHSKHGRLRSIDPNGDFRTALFAADANVGNPGRPFHHGPGFLRDAPCIVEVFAADFQGQARVVVAAAEHPEQLGCRPRDWRGR